MPPIATIVFGSKDVGRTATEAPQERDSACAVNAVHTGIMQAVDAGHTGIMRAGYAGHTGIMRAGLCVPCKASVRICGVAQLRSEAQGAAPPTRSCLLASLHTHATIQTSF